MRKFPALTALCVAFACMTYAQSRGGNWPTYGGDAQRSAWQGTDVRLNKATVKDLQLLWKIKLESQPKGLRPLMPPLILGRLISYRGFRELAFVGTNADIVYAIDADLGTLFWQKHLEYSTNEPQATGSSWACPGGMTAMPTMPTPAAPGARGARGRGAAVPAPTPGRGTGNGFIGGGNNASVYAISSDGRLHRLNTSTGDDMTQPVSVLPANARAHSLNMADNVIYTVTSQECSGTPNAVWAIDLNGEAPKARSFALNDGGVWGLGGPVIGSDGTIYVQTGDGVFDPAKNQWANTLLALSPGVLQLKQYFTSSSPESTLNKATARGADMNVTSPVTFTYKDRDLIATAGKDGRLYLLDSAAPGGEDHRTPLFRTPPIVATEDNAPNRGIWGSLSSWQDTDGTRWVLAAVWGPVRSDLRIPGAGGASPNGSIVAFKVEENAGRTVLTPAWVSRDLSSPAPPVMSSGMVFALSAGEFTRQIKESAEGVSIDERPRGSTHATLYALDATTGKELYSSRNLVTAPAALTGLTVANGRVYFGTTDSVFYTFGIYMER